MKEGDEMNRKGMTLIEIIIAMFLLGVISIAFLPSISSSYSMMKDSRRFTVDSFATQQEMEKKMEEARNLDDTTVDFFTTKDIFGKKIGGYEITYPLGNRNEIYAFIPDIKRDDYPVPIAINVKNEPKRGGENLEIPYALDSDLRFCGSNDIDPSTSNLLLTTLYKWYVSNDSFDPIVPENNIDEIEIGTRYPRWPYDYTEIKNETKKDLRGIDFSEFKDRHIVFSVIPVAKSGKYGKEVSSNPIYLSGLPRLNNLLLHLDASLLEGNPRVKEDVTSPILEWKSACNEFVAKTFNTNRISELHYENREGGRYGAKYISTNGNELKIDDNGSFKSKGATIFVVMKSNGKSSNIISRNNWWLSLYKDHIGDYINFNGSGPWYIDEGRHVLVGRLGSIRGDNGYSLFIDGELKIEDNRYQHNNNNNRGNIIIGQKNNESNVDIYEIIMYNKWLSDKEIEEINNYLFDKYNIKSETTEP